MSNPITEGWETFKITCQICKQTQEVQADPDRIARHHNGGLVQDVWIEATDEYREMMIGIRSGHWICGKSHNDCWTKLFGSDETDDYGIGDSQM